MKAFVISVSIVLILFLLTILNSVYVDSTINDLIERARALQVDNNSVAEFLSIWEEKQFFIMLSSSHEETHKIDETIGVLSAKAQENDASGFSEERALLVEYLTQILEDESISLESII